MTALLADAVTRDQNDRLLFWCVAANAQLSGADGPITAGQAASGDVLLTPDGHSLNLRHAWPLETHAAPTRALCIAADALGPGCPSADLFLPAETVLLLDSTPVPASALVNDATVQWRPGIPQDWCGLFAHQHDRNDACLCANNVALQSQTVTDIDAAADAWRGRAVRPTSTTGLHFTLPADHRHADLRRMLADRALLLGHDRIGGPDITLRIGNTTLAPDCTGGLCHFTLPPSLVIPCDPVTLQSRSSIPAVLSAGPDDFREWRRLGVAVARIIADSRKIPLNHWTLGHGWHEPEPGWRWTDGAAQLRLPPATRHLRIEIANVLAAYGLPQPEHLPTTPDADR